MAVEDMVGGVANKSSPLISFHCIIDEDLALISNVIINYRNPNVFNLNIDKTYHDIVGDIYRRKYKNPLYYLMKDEKYKDFLDNCYDDFIHEHEEEVLKYAVSTEMYNLIQDFQKSTDISPTILYYTASQERFLNDDSNLKDIPKISIGKVVSNKTIMNSYTQYYFKFIDEAKDNDFIYLHNKTFYFSTVALNLNEENTDMRDEDFFLDVFKNESKINLFEMYRTDIIGRYNNDK